MLHQTPGRVELVLADGAGEHHGLVAVGVGLSVPGCPPLLRVILLQLSQDTSAEKDLGLTSRRIIIMEVEHGSSGEFLARMRGYMPPVQRELIAWVTGRPGMRSEAEVSK